MASSAFDDSEWTTVRRWKSKGGKRAGSAEEHQAMRIKLERLYDLYHYGDGNDEKKERFCVCCANMYGYIMGHVDPNGKFTVQNLRLTCTGCEVDTGHSMLKIHLWMNKQV